MYIQKYIDEARETAIYPNQGLWGGFTYTVFGLAGELGEVFEVMKKIIRDSNGDFSNLDRIKKEVGDVLWYFSQAMVESVSSFTDKDDIDDFQKRLYEQYLDGHEAPKLDNPHFIYIQGDLLADVHILVSEVLKHHGIIMKEQDHEKRNEFMKRISQILVEIFKVTSLFLANLDIKISEVMQMNLDKLSARKEAGKLQGSGEEIHER